jgi:hypothetical protein
MAKAIFDTNVFKKVSDPPVNDPSFSAYAKIKSLIASGEIVAFISETIFTLEGIKRKERKKTISQRRGKLKTDTSVEGNTVHQGFSFGPERGHDFGDNEQLRGHFLKAIAAGFKVVSLPRIAGYVNEEVESHLFKHKTEDLEAFHTRAFEVSEKIEQKGAGLAALMALGREFDPIWQKGLGKVPGDRRNKIAELVGEWADGDSVAIAIGLQCDYFCTVDMARTAGQKSGLSAVNKAWLSSDYQFRTITPENLASLFP